MDERRRSSAVAGLILLGGLFLAGQLFPGLCYQDRTHGARLTAMA